MENSVITLKQLSRLQHGIGQGIRICVCDSEDSIEMEVLSKYDMDFFKEIPKVFSSTLYKWKVFRIDTCNDLMCVYVVER